MSETLQRTPLYDAHVKLGGKLVPFAGWEMPVNYPAGLLAEHEAVRTRVGIFDVSHMGQFEFHGPDAIAAVDKLVTNDIRKLEVGRAAYAGLLNERGTFIDDVFVYKLAPEHLLMVVNASNVQKDFDWVASHCPRGLPQNRSANWGLIAVQGPRAVELVQSLVDVQLPPHKNSITQGKVSGVDALVARSGYTGEDGFELFCDAQKAGEIWDAVLDTGRDAGAKLIGLGARDTLRLEMGYALYGNELSEATNPLEAGLGWVVKPAKGAFVGSQAIEAVRAKGLARKMVGFELVERGVPRHGYPVVAAGAPGSPIGEVTSGTSSPSLGRGIGMAYVSTAHAALGSEIGIEVRGKPFAARVVKPPFVPAHTKK